MVVSTLTQTVTLERQCAWCWRAADADGEYTIEVGHNLIHDGLKHVSHGICEDCSAEFLAE